MGYESNITLDVKLIDGVENKLLAEMEAIGYAGCFEIDEGYLMFTESFGKWGDGSDMAKVLAKYVVSGKLEFDGEDGTRWGYEFDNGNVYEIEYTTKRGEKITFAESGNGF